MSEPQIERFEMDTLESPTGHEATGMFPHPDGQWVRYADVVSLLAERDKWCAHLKQSWETECAHEREMREVAEAERERLMRENAELREDVDALRPGATNYYPMFKRATAAEHRAEALVSAIRDYFDVENKADRDKKRTTLRRLVGRGEQD